MIHKGPATKNTSGSQSNQTDCYDVAILGTGIAGTLLGAILARHGVRVIMIDAGAHPRFVIGESTIPNTSLMLELLATRFDVPEIKALASPEGVLRSIGSSCGVKRNFGFVYHRERQRQNPTETNQIGVSKMLRAPENHMFRQDVDAYMLHVAVRYGADIKQETRITDITFDPDKVQLRTADGTCFNASFLADASGFRSPLRQKLNLNEEPSRLKHHSRCLFTHMIDVTPYDDHMHAMRDNNMSSLWFEGTLHHLFDGGWIWVIPFNNQEHSTNPLCSVGLTLDPRRFPKTHLPPEQEFFDFIARFPDVAVQFTNAKAVRDWVSTDRLQYSSTHCVGDRFCLMAHSAGFIDALFSRGLINTTEVVNAVAERLLEAVKDGDFSAARFAYINDLQQKLLDYNDTLVNCSFISFGNFELWNVWFRIWALGTACIELKLNRSLHLYHITGNRDYLTDFYNPPYPGLLFPHHERYRHLFDSAAADIEAVEAGRMSSDTAVRHILTLLNEFDYAETVFPPLERPMIRPFFWAMGDPASVDLNVNLNTYMRWLFRGRWRHATQPQPA